MGILRSLTADEIIVQVFYAVKIRRIVQSLVNDVNKAHLLSTLTIKRLHSCHTAQNHTNYFIITWF
jgi:hypothetical protein